MNLISLKRKPRKDNKPIETVSTSDELYPYGLRIRLEKEEMTKLGLDTKKLKIGQVVNVQGVGNCLTLYEKGVEIQLTAIAVSTGRSAKFAEYEKAQKAGPGE